MTGSSPPQRDRSTVSALQAPLIKKALSFLHAGDLAAADLLAARLRDSDPDGAGSKGLQGILALARGDLVVAEQALMQARTCCPDAMDIVQPLVRLLVRQGRGAEARTVLFDVLGRDPCNGLAYNELARLSIGEGAWPLALEAAEKAAQWASEDGDVWNNLGMARRHAGQSDEAEAAFRTCLRLAPDTVAALNNLAALLLGRGAAEAACAVVDRALFLSPHSVQALRNKAQLLRLGGTLAEMATFVQDTLTRTPLSTADQAALLTLWAHAQRDHNPEKALPLYDRALAVHEGSGEAWNGKAMALVGLLRRDEALACFQKAVAIFPEAPDLWANIAMVQVQLGRLDNARAAVDRALRLDPDHGGALNAKGWWALRRDGPLAARDCFARVLEQEPDNPVAVANLAHVYRSAAMLEEAEALCGDALRRGVVNREILNTRAVALLEQRRLIEAEQAFIDAIDHDVTFPQGTLSNLCMASHYDVECGLAERADLHRRYGVLCRPAGDDLQRPYGNDRSASRRLRVGFLSGDLRVHSVAFFLHPLLSALDPAQVSVTLYSTALRRDWMTDRLQQAAEALVDVSALSSQDLIDRIMDDRIDVLFDLSGHSAENRLSVLARHPAPVQFTWLGYPGTTGVEGMSGRLVDAVSDPEPAPNPAPNPKETSSPAVQGDPEWASEPLIRLPRCFLAYEAPPDAPAVGPLPCLGGAGFTFGSFNAGQKINDLVLDDWAAILGQVPDSRLYLKAKQWQDLRARTDVLAALDQRGIPSERVKIAGFADSFADHMGQYGQVDLALDTYPYNGTTTTCEALWMGVPTLTIAGDRHAARVGASLLHSVGLEEIFVVADRDAYVMRARDLAADPALLSRVRAGARQRLQHSPLGDAAGLARAMETVMRREWQIWCADPDARRGAGLAPPRRFVRYEG